MYSHPGLGYLRLGRLFIMYLFACCCCYIRRNNRQSPLVLSLSEWIRIESIKISRRFRKRRPKMSDESQQRRPVAYLTRREIFSAAHRLYSNDLSENENVEIYSKCASANGHGHNYTVEVSVRGAVDSVTGMVMNIQDLKLLMDEVIQVGLDHKNIDKDVEYFKNVVSTTENVAVYIWKEISRRLKERNFSAILHKVKIWETDKNIVEYRGEHE